MNVWGWIIVVLLVALLVLELKGVGDRRPGDTITEVYKGIRDRLPTPIAMIWGLMVTGLLMWTILHFWDLV